MSDRIAPPRDELVCKCPKSRTTLLQNYSWPGNVRELENLIERLAIDVPPTGIGDLHYSFDVLFC